MLITEKVIQKWNAKTQKHYIQLGYRFTKMRDEFEVKVNDLTNGSNVKVKVKCDYCGKLYTKPWYNYLLENQQSFIHKDCCNSCKKYKIQEVAQNKYGVASVFLLDDIKEKISKTNIEKYGTENPFAADCIKNKIIETNLIKYGVPYSSQVKEVKEKAKATCREKYGVDYYIETQVFYGEDNHNWKGGVAHLRNERATLKYIQWRKSIYSRDSYTCQCCGYKYQAGSGIYIKLNAHHIYNWKDYPDKRYDIDNGITFCEKCHIKFHLIFGKKNNNKKQLTNFLNNYGKKIC